MNKFFSLILLFISGITFGQNNQELLNINGKSISVDEFKYVYEKNNGKEANYSKGSLDEYLDLYTKFKLKVERAKDLKIDTISSLKEELNGYKRQLANSYLLDKEVMDNLIKEAFERSKHDIRISHLMISVDDKKPGADAEALVTIQRIKQEIANGKPWADAVKAYSTDKASIDKGGDLGYFSAMLPDGFYELENAMYQTPLNTVSAPIRTKLGYHLVKPTEKREARGVIEVSHILIRKNADDGGNAKERIFDLHNKLNEGADFGELAEKYSEDQSSAKAKGQLAAFGVNQLERTFEDAAFALTKDGEISQPIETKIGWHIIKRNSLKKHENDIQIYKKINENKIKKDGRTEIARKKLIENIKKAGKYAENATLLQKFTASLNEDFLSFKWTPDEALNFNNEVLASFGSAPKFTVSDFAHFCKKNTRNRLKYDKNVYKDKLGEVVNSLMADFIDEKSIEFEQQNLEAKYQDFRALIKEYEDGILLFEATKQAVWDKANQDTIGLQKFYDSKPNAYFTDEKGKIVSFTTNAKDQKTLNKIMEYASENSPEKTLSKFNKKDVTVAFVEEVLDRSNQKFGGIDWKVGSISEAVKDQNSGNTTFRRLAEIIPPKKKSLKEARGFVVAEYQEYLENQWIQELKKAYPVVINQTVYKSIIK